MIRVRDVGRGHPRASPEANRSSKGVSQLGFRFLGIWTMQLTIIGVYVWNQCMESPFFRNPVVCRNIPFYAAGAWTELSIAKSRIIRVWTGLKSNVTVQACKGRGISSNSESTSQCLYRHLGFGMSLGWGWPDKPWNTTLKRQTLNHSTQTPKEPVERFFCLLKPTKPSIRWNPVNQPGSLLINPVQTVMSPWAWFLSKKLS